MGKLKMHSLDGVERNIGMIGKLFPNAVTEVMRNGKVEHAIDFDVLRQELSDTIVERREERYQFTWPDKKKAMLAANAPITATLRPIMADSVGRDGTPGVFDSENLYIEGDNLEVLKLLQETYLGKVKMIYIDPPYNTGNDFVYEDDFAQNAADYMGNSGQYDEARTPEDLLFQVILDLGVLLSSPIEVKEIAGKKVFNVSDGFLLACFDHDVTEETVKAIAQMKPYYAVFRDSSMANDSVATNFDQIFETCSLDTVRKVL